MKKNSKTIRVIDIQRVASIPVLPGAMRAHCSTQFNQNLSRDLLILRPTS